MTNAVNTTRIEPPGLIRNGVRFVLAEEDVWSDGGMSRLLGIPGLSPARHDLLSSGIKIRSPRAKYGATFVIELIHAVACMKGTLNDALFQQKLNIVAERFQKHFH